MGVGEAARRTWLLVGVFVIAVSGLVYELLAGTLSSYLLGDSVYQFSLVIGLFMSAMGLGAYLSRFIHRDLEAAFVLAQTALGLIGGLSALILFFAFGVVENYEPFLWLLCVALGSLIGLEIPLVTRILQARQSLKVNLSNVLTVDYIGALVAALLFPLVLVPRLGLIHTGLLFGGLNLAVGMLAVGVLRLPPWRWLPGLAAGMALLAGLAWYSQQLTGFFEQRLYHGEIIHAETTPYQRLVLTRRGARARLFLNGSLQFDSLDEYRYHEALVHPAMALARRKARVLILGGGDGMAAREVLRYPAVESITLVDLDPAMTELFRENPLARRLNEHSLRHPKVTIHNQDAWKFLEQTEAFFDVAIIDLPDPHHPQLSKLYTRAFYRLLASRLGRDGLFVTQATSPVFAPEAFWCVARTVDTTPSPTAWEETLFMLPYHAYVPSFGDWGFVLGGQAKVDWASMPLPEGLRFLTPEMLPSLIRFAADSAPVPGVEVNTLHTHALLRYYEQGWAKWFP